MASPCVGARGSINGSRRSDLSTSNFAVHTACGFINIRSNRATVERCSGTMSAMPRLLIGSRIVGWFGRILSASLNSEPSHWSGYLGMSQEGRPESVKSKFEFTPYDFDWKDIAGLVPARPPAHRQPGA